MDIAIGQTATVVRTVTEADTAIAVGSGDLPVLGTPVLLAWLEAATVQACTCGEDETSVGVRIGLDHTRASGIGTEVTCHAEVAEIDGRNVVFKVKATQGEELIARGVVTRAVVERQRILDRL